LDREGCRHDGVEVRRGDLVTVALQGDYGKPRPAVVIQSDLFSDHPTVTVLPLTSELRDAPTFRIFIAPSSRNGLKSPSQVMVDKAHTVLRQKVGKPFGRLELGDITAVNRALTLFLGFI